MKKLLSIGLLLLLALKPKARLLKLTRRQKLKLSSQVKAKFPRSTKLL